jgi:hypothetical protein
MALLIWYREHHQLLLGRVEIVLDNMLSGNSFRDHP